MTASKTRNEARARLALLSFVLCLTASFALALPAAAEPPDDPLHPELRDFFRTGKYVLFISGKEQKNAKIYHSRRAGAFLITGSDYGRALLVEPKVKKLSAIDEAEVALSPNLGVDVVKNAKVEPLGSFRIERGGNVAIKVKGLVARLRPQEHLIGLKKADDLLLHSPEYARDGRNYKPGANELKRLEEANKTAVVRVYFGTWCHTCARLLPRILKVDKALEGTKIQFEYYGLPKGARAMARDPLARRNNIKRIPTGLVTVDGRSAGRINSTMFARPELAVCQLVLKQ